ncbi:MULTISPECIES: exopolysaccharide biosynthesis polyprenyl glycosylphosphotransferase [unclassified Streptomyces]|uniref:exopolysaccharide biosynthesis polyprenyl glycosylphosphotransferase n=1 Tax=unclassified Streptomyces TaxID=2593676 RepID=UPI00225A84BB|nr:MULTISPECIES: exopolysaccharide biosynthesis polyprenyl glycosylphosphotransferase [unclassified Streptomyces]MCX4784858.1 exopolysaccharide biosynthesis polyprenyl glycosylphosphotransferase [Streptomyces sp. NBC_01221]WSJ40379.1 exopolysaccharide biosynthesis polyprenyl glycosylphosphotransferase [Streptomyces sp. NBC_01321]WSP66685.1 exopolysaccharide biosynthesis polyprenyl glycosylphosphotransferase [Streptomyces sp. NBC_01240]
MGLAGAPRPRTASNRPRGKELDDAWRAPAGQRERSGPAAARRRSGRRLQVVIGVELLGLGIPAWLVLWAGGQPRPGVAAAVAALAWSGVRAVRGRYTGRSPGDPPGVLTTAGDWLLLIGVLAVLRTMTGDAVDPVTAVVALLPGLPAGLAAWGVRRLRRHRTVRRVLVVGEASRVERAVRLLGSRADHPYRVVAAVPVGTAPLECEVQVPGRLAPAPADDDASTVLGGAFAHDADLALVVPGPQLSEERLRRLSWGLHDGGLPLSVLSELSGIAAGRIRPSAAAGLTLLHVAPPVRRGPQMILKAMVDRIGAALGLLVLAPLLLLIGAAVRLGSDGPALHRQIRHGQHSRPFTMWKFRTMVVDAERHKQQLITANEKDGPMFKMRRDPRVTGIGRLLRRTSLDELPQLLNVLRGDMSLVGPRPPLPEEVSRYDERELRRLAVKPGLTGLWQVSGRSDLSWPETVSLDLWYVDNWSVATDMGLMARTLRAVTDGRGAY